MTTITRKLLDYTHTAYLIAQALAGYYTALQTDALLAAKRDAGGPVDGGTP